MNERTVLYKNITKFAFGFLIILINISIAGFDILPDFVGYILFISAISALKKRYKKINLLNPLAIILLIWSVIAIIIPYFATNETVILITDFITLVISIIQIYFNFQLLTQIGAIAKEYDEETKLDKRLMKLRNIYTVLNTVLTSLANVPVLITLKENEIVLWGITILTVFTVIIAIIIAVTLFSVRKLFKKNNKISSDGTQSQDNISDSSI